MGHLVTWVHLHVPGHLLRATEAVEHLGGAARNLGTVGQAWTLIDLGKIAVCSDETFRDLGTPAGA